MKSKNCPDCIMVETTYNSRDMCGDCFRDSNGIHMVFTTYGGVPPKAIAVDKPIDVDGVDTMYVSETHYCSECNHYRRDNYDIPICIKKLMGVTSNMLVYYKQSEGTCFEQK
jgi:hypothetical protein